MAEPNLNADSESRKPITAERLREALHYDQETGVFTRRQSRGNSNAGKVLGSPRILRYRSIMIDRRNYSLQRLAWLYVYGRWPDLEIDHIDRDPANNRIANLREVTHAENMQNVGIQVNNTTGFKGVYLDKRRGKWLARIQANGREYSLGSFVSKEQAGRAYQEAAMRLHNMPSL